MDLVRRNKEVFISIYATILVVTAFLYSFTFLSTDQRQYAETNLRILSGIKSTWENQRSLIDGYDGMKDSIRKIEAHINTMEQKIADLRTEQDTMAGRIENHRHKWLKGGKVYYAH